MATPREIQTRTHEPMSLADASVDISISGRTNYNLRSSSVVKPILHGGIT